MDHTEEFPFDDFPWKLVYKDRNETRKCYFQTEEHRKQHMVKYKLKKKDVKLSYKIENE